MTIKEALEILCKGIAPNPTANNECIKLCKSALEKQIPKKPNIHGYREGREVNTISYTCPICNKHIGRDAFCKHCGQKLDLESEVQGE
jgi:hypothetical protein